MGFRLTALVMLSVAGVVAVYLTDASALGSDERPARAAEAAAAASADYPGTGPIDAALQLTTTANGFEAVTRGGHSQSAQSHIPESASQRPGEAA